MVAPLANQSAKSFSLSLEAPLAVQVGVRLSSGAEHPSVPTVALYRLHAHDGDDDAPIVHPFVLLCLRHCASGCACIFWQEYEDLRTPATRVFSVSGTPVDSVIVGMHQVRCPPYLFFALNNTAFLICISKPQPRCVCTHSCFLYVDLAP